MTVEENEAIIRRFFEEIWNKGELDQIDKFFASNYVAHGSTYPVHGPEGAKQVVIFYRTGFPNGHVTIEDIIAQGDKVVTRWTAQGTHTGEMRDIPPNGKQATVTGITIHRIASGKIVESWTSWDDLGELQQLGVVPTPEQSSIQAKGK